MKKTFLTFCSVDTRRNMFNTIILIIPILVLVSGQETKYSGCGNVPLSSQIVGGTVAKKGDWPWIVSLQNQKNGFHHCAGTVIGSQWILTAARCFEMHPEPSYWKVILGKVSLSKDEGTEEYRSIEKIITPGGDYQNLKDDIGLVKLDTPLKLGNNIYPACLPDKDRKVMDGEKCTAIGWGKTSFKGTSSMELQQVILPIYNQKKCTRTYGKKDIEINEKMICAGYVGGKKGTCTGDSGGPLLCLNPDNKWNIVGITSFGIECAKSKYPSVFSRVMSYRDWIAENMK